MNLDFYNASQTKIDNTSTNLQRTFQMSGYRSTLSFWHFRCALSVSMAATDLRLTFVSLTGIIPFFLHLFLLGFSMHLLIYCCFIDISIFYFQWCVQAEGVEQTSSYSIEVKMLWSCSYFHILSPSFFRHVGRYFDYSMNEYVCCVKTDISFDNYSTKLSFYFTLQIHITNKTLRGCE